MVASRTKALWHGSDDVSYGVVLALIGLTYLASVAVTGPVGSALVLLLQMVVLVLVLRASHARLAVRLLGTAAMLAAVVIAGIALVTRPESHAGTIGRSPTLELVFVLSAILYGIAPLSILRHQLTRPAIDGQTLIAAIAAYLMLGMFFAFSYRAIAEFQTTPFFGSAGTGTVADDLFFSFVTLTTTGYGNLVPAGNPGQTFAVTEAIVGQLFLVTAVAKIVNESGLLSGRAQRGRAEAAASASDDPAGSDPAAEPQPS